MYGDKVNSMPQPNFGPRRERSIKHAACRTVKLVTNSQRGCLGGLTKSRRCKWKSELANKASRAAAAALVGRGVVICSTAGHTGA
jgi:hypothetical protein